MFVLKEPKEEVSVVFWEDFDVSSKGSGQRRLREDELKEIHTQHTSSSEALLLVHLEVNTQKNPTPSFQRWRGLTAASQLPDTRRVADMPCLSFASARIYD
jgi:hypothetical protein